MATKFSDNFIDDLPEAAFAATDEADAAFWDEFFLQEDKKEEDRERRYTITITDEVSGKAKTFKHVRLVRKQRNAD
ncbi:hypothetical protein A3A66_03470 [Microgenomates group bacterium RIFCSPLOWO2_01_FULL_46_13]|nr:MAG: hypothetical protein A2783_04650 [Microgenomates group bacterium RIFCSPHIGHO2_01_FULL_45_11]OGV95048.1 MAG: hypothetical protein A3A66_03470 [Microgenomates group bacterium RIFCSPLOWO2_01_FULL_46_13]